MTAPDSGAATLRVNGEVRPLGPGGLPGVLRDLGLDPAARGLAVAHNGAVVPRADWDRAQLKDGDTVEVVKLFAGG